MHACALRRDDGTITGAVGSAYDITALRERENDLRAFAAVAAHDLKAPLAAVAGYAEILEHDLPDNPDTTERQPLQRITASVHRMSQLIDDLLCYATARDAPLNLEPVDLQHITAEIITERTGHLRNTRNNTDALFPDIYTGHLPVIEADAAMIRQLLDNLIGNAIKYTLPGQPARIDISAQPHPDPHLTRITIADRGIGIPTDEQPHVFSTFHRAAAHTQGYTGHRPRPGHLPTHHRPPPRHHHHHRQPRRRHPLPPHPAHTNHHQSLHPHHPPRHHNNPNHTHRNTRKHRRTHLTETAQPTHRQHPGPTHRPLPSRHKPGLITGIGRKRQTPRAPNAAGVLRQ